MIMVVKTDNRNKFKDITRNKILLETSLKILQSKRIREIKRDIREIKK